MKKYILLTTLILSAVFCSSNLSAQEYIDLVKENPYRAANIYYPYHRMDSVYTQAPKGYKPFYISHYGRHGSRYHTSEKYIEGAVKTLQKANNEGLLTSQGKEALKEMEILLAAHQGMTGELSPRGGREHRQIAERMYDNFSVVFKNKNRQEVHCVSSPYSRCLMSMANFTTELKNEKPSLQFSFVTGNKYFSYICNNIGYDNWVKDANVVEKSIREKICTHNKLFATLFTDPDKAEKLMDNPDGFAKDMYISGSICGDLDFLNLDIFKFFDKEELAKQAMARNARIYGMMGNSKELGQYTSDAAKNLVKDFVDKADTALMAGSHVAADLRFGHDTGILPFLNCLQVEGMNVRRPMTEAQDHWMAFDMTPMATNFQMIFYKNKKGDVLVKMLYNEKETTIPAVSPYVGPYYKWNTLKKYLMSLYQ